LRPARDAITKNDHGKNAVEDDAPRLPVAERVGDGLAKASPQGDRDINCKLGHRPCAILAVGGFAAFLLAAECFENGTDDGVSPGAERHTLGRWLPDSEVLMASTRQRATARRNVKKAAQAARRKRTIAHLPKKTRTALGKQAAKVAKQKRRRSA
jgi:hypothetical protein